MEKETKGNKRQEKKENTTQEEEGRKGNENQCHASRP